MAHVLQRGDGVAHSILIVDDSPVLRTAAKNLLIGAGYLVSEAADGAKGLTMLGAAEILGKRPSLIFTDINMPVMDGLTFISEVKKTPNRFTPILVLTTEAHEEVRARGRAAGAAGWLVKPYTDAQLLDVVKKFCR
jgi:two-component system chemotaxis response regulator CheY